MKWKTWWIKLGRKSALALLPLIIASVEELRTPDIPPWRACLVAIVLIAAEQLNNWLKHRHDPPPA